MQSICSYYKILAVSPVPCSVSLQLDGSWYLLIPFPSLAPLPRYPQFVLCIAFNFSLHSSWICPVSTLKSLDFWTLASGRVDTSQTQFMPVPLSMWQSIVDQHLHTRPSNTHRQVWLSLWGSLPLYPVSWCAQGFVPSKSLWRVWGLI